MSTFYTANKDLVAYLLELGMVKHPRGEEETILYFTNHSNNKQIKVEVNYKLVTLLSDTGKVVDYSSSFTDTQILNFLEIEQ